MKILILLSALIVFSVSAMATDDLNQSVCVDKLSVQTFDLEKLDRTDGTFEKSADEGRQAFDHYLKFSDEIKNALPQELVFNLLSSFELTILRANLLRLIEEINKYKITTVAGLAVALKTRLNGQVLDSTVSSRIVEFLRSPSEKTFLKVLGDNSLQEMQEYMYGADPLNPSAESLLGQYIKETGAATLVRTFPQTGKARRQGTPKLVVAVSSETAEKYHKYFDKPEFPLHYHYPEQGTLQFGQAGVIGSYGSLSRNDFVRFTELGTIVPHIVLKTTEAGRARNFFRLGARNIEIALTPWLLTGYCAMGGYSSCTHWVGNIPIGDEKVESYTFPGKIDRFAHNEVSKKPQTQILQPYNDYVDDKNLTSVWTVPGHMQLWEVLGLRGPQIGGLLASPGFVAHVLSARTSVERVPVVFLVVKDHKAPIPANFPMWTNPI